MSDLIFLQSLHDHQYLVNIIKNNRNAEGVCTLEMKELSIITSKSLGWLKHAMKRINYDEPCIVRVKSGLTLNYANLIEKGTFHNVFMLNQQYQLDRTIADKPVSAIRRKYGYSANTIKLFKKYISVNDK